MAKSYHFTLLPEHYGVARYSNEEAARAFYVKTIFRGGLWSLTITEDEASLVGPVDALAEYDQIESDWRTLKLQGPLDFSEIGILSDITEVLKKAKVSVFALSTYDTDYILVKQESLETACASLTEQGHQIEGATASLTA